MGLGEVWWLFERTPEQGVERLLELLDLHGVKLRQPVDKLIYVFDEVGSRREAPLSFIVAEWVAQGVLTMQLWVDEDTDVIVTAEAGGTCVTFSLDGLSRQQAVRIVADLVLCASVVDETRVVVVDHLLPEGGEVWLNTSGSGQIAFNREPDLLVRAERDGPQIKVGRESWLREW